ncbi:hypothetical protein [Armatimonas sp.]|uniref:hypothetical protein n=1 Tax=Armatimonas sp. TaxID=1872638 RepID=UPI00286B9BD8|nr:hypothetical protein [Armatimonas sp.]
MAVMNLDYIPLMVKVIAHWQQVETKTGRPLLLKDKTTIDGFTDLKDQLKAQQSARITEQNDRQRAQEERDGALKTLHPMVKQARTSLKGLTEDVLGAKALPAFVASGSNPQKYLQAARDIAEVWATVNTAQDTALTIPVLDGQTTIEIGQAQYVAAVDRYAAAVEALTAAQTTETLGKKTRDNLQKSAKVKLVAYPLAAKGRLADGDPLRATIPTLSGG